jgi:copper chaperone NosL
MSANVIKALLLAVALVAISIAFVRFNRPTLHEGPVPVVWDSEVCAHCKMHVGDPRFAAQLQTTRGDVLNFDDPGCLLEYLGSHDPSVHGIYFRDYTAEGWLPEAEAGFVSVEDSPMGYGLAAVPRGTSGAQDIDWAKAKVKTRPHNRNGGP